MKQLFFSFTFLISTVALSAPADHLKDLKSKFPYGLLGDDHGVLTENDLAINACRFKSHPFPPKAWISPYEYWQCFESKKISFHCDGSGVPDKYEGIEGLVVVEASIGQTHHEYIERRLWPIRECRRFLKDLKVLLNDSPYVCISGSFLNDETNRSGVKTTSWLFERLKTSKGCEGRNCDFTAEMRREYCSTWQVGE